MMYLIGPLELLKQLFPSHDWSHARVSLDGSEGVIEAVVTPEIDQKLQAEGVFVLDHAEAIAYLNDPDMIGIWTPESEGVE
ncbi:MAG: hypothetical protein HUU02_03835 [Bacteroidetes bacterium]|nr:hypothetical protein [Bacteroidota bacterium]